MVEPFAHAYPNLKRWVTTRGWIEVGDDGMQSSRVRMLDEGGLIWAGSDATAQIDNPLREAETAVARWIAEEVGG
ncbi:MAG: hypothetical protein U0031_06245 [Thermomicrobiales bacterium]